MSFEFYDNYGIIDAAETESILSESFSLINECIIESTEYIAEGFFEDVWNFIKKIFSKIWGFIRAVFTGIINLLLMPFGKKIGSGAKESSTPGGGGGSGSSTTGGSGAAADTSVKATSGNIVDAPVFKSKGYISFTGLTIPHPYGIVRDYKTLFLGYLTQINNVMVNKAAPAEMKSDVNNILKTYFKDELENVSTPLMMAEIIGKSFKYVKELIGIGDKGIPSKVKDDMNKIKGVLDNFMKQSNTNNTSSGNKSKFDIKSMGDIEFTETLKAISNISKVDIPTLSKQGNTKSDYDDLIDMYKYFNFYIETFSSAIEKLINNKNKAGVEYLKSFIKSSGTIISNRNKAYSEKGDDAKVFKDSSSTYKYMKSIIDKTNWTPIKAKRLLSLELKTVADMNKHMDSNVAGVLLSTAVEGSHDISLIVDLNKEARESLNKADASTKKIDQMKSVNGLSEGELAELRKAVADYANVVKGMMNAVVNSTQDMITFAYFTLCSTLDITIINIMMILEHFMRTYTMICYAYYTNGTYDKDGKLIAGQENTIANRKKEISEANRKIIDVMKSDKLLQ